MKDHNYYVYIMTNINHSVLYTGVTNDITRRIYEHKNKTIPSSFTAKYNLTKLVYLEYFGDINEAISREKQIKGKSREKKILLIEVKNRGWQDLCEQWEMEDSSSLPNAGTLNDILL
ncbi:MAG: GIY-YIG nuclease family protein [Deltaproteobacteria bacterium]|nr:GIY-YIG nuclease family protein [Deltaproteobacteria bacterium]